jgi:hypothetical protein
MQKFKVTLEKEIIIEFDENSDSFKELWEGYKEFIDSDADYESLAENIASQISRYGVDEMIEGVGYVKHNGENQDIFHDGKYEEQEGYVNVEAETDINGMVIFDINYTENLIEEA